MRHIPEIEKLILLDCAALVERKVIIVPNSTSDGDFQVEVHVGAGHTIEKNTLLHVSNQGPT